jgi:hypothetical protein
MNQLTRDLVIEVSKKYRRDAKRNDSDFRELVEIAYQGHTIESLGIDYKFRALEIFKALYPECFDDYGFLDGPYSLDFDLSALAVRVMDRKIKRTPDLQLHYDWGDLPEITADPQIRMF